MTKEVCVCIDRDGQGESACKDATCDPALWGFVCHHKCVIALTKRLRAERSARIDAEAKLEKYRNAIRPFVQNCRDVVAAVDEKECEVSK